MPSYYDTHYEDEQDWTPVLLQRPKDVKASCNNTRTNTFTQTNLFTRSRQGYTAHQMAQLLHMKVGMYNRIEAGKIDPPPESIPRLRKLLFLKL